MAPGRAVDIDALSRVKWPAIGLMVVGMVTFLGQLVFLVIKVRAISEGAAEGGDDGLSEVIGGGLRLPFILISALLGLAVFQGGRWMKRLRNYEFAMVAAVLAMLPCSVFCLLGLPFGLWALVVLHNDEVRREFLG